MVVGRSFRFDSSARGETQCVQGSLGFQAQCLFATQLRPMVAKFKTLKYININLNVNH